MKPIVLLITILSLFLFISSKQAPDTGSEPPVIKITAHEYGFQGVPDTLAAGWTTIHFENHGQQPHFFLLHKAPEGKNLDHFVQEVIPPFDAVWHELRDGKITRQQLGEEFGKRLPEWFMADVQMGGPGLTEPGETTQTTLKLDPGTYVLECYLKDLNTEFHASMGMVRQIVVAGEANPSTPPDADIRINLGNENIDVEGEPTAGVHTIAVYFKEHPETGPPNDIHLVRLGEGADIDTLKYWMDWTQEGGLQPPEPAGVHFLGGAQEMPADYTAYFTATLEPGQYAWVTETISEQVRVKPFNVKAQTATAGDR